jgi:adenosylcobyric acid synthase
MSVGPAVPARLRGAVMVCGTTSNAGKSTVVGALCRLLARRGVRVAPFKAQNMALNSAVTAAGHEIGRAQAAQAFAAGVAPDVAMNPVLLKPTGDRTSQVVVEGRPLATMTAAEYHAYKPRLLPIVLDALADLRARFDVVVCEGAGSPAEINLLDHDIVNLRIARDGRMPAIVVGDIDPGGVFAALYGTVALLPDEYRGLVQGFVLNKFRGDPALLLDGCADLRERCGVPTLGILPWLDDVGLDAEDSLALRADGPSATPPALADALDVAVVRFPRIANFTDLDPLVQEPGVHVRFVHDAAAVGRPDLVVLPGTKATVTDLAWLRTRGFDRAIATTPATVLGICGGYQMLGRTIDDRFESGAGVVDGLSILPVHTTFAADKRTQRCTGTALGHPVDGYVIHHGRVQADGGDAFVVDAHGVVDGVRHEHVFGTTVHGLFEADAFRRAFLTIVAERAGKRFVPGTHTFAALRQARVDRLADAFEGHVDVDAVLSLIASAAPADTATTAPTATRGAR